MPSYTRTDAWSIKNKGITYSIQPWKFESIAVEILDLHVSISSISKIIKSKHDTFFDETYGTSICGKVKIPRIGFVGEPNNGCYLQEICDLNIFPIDSDFLENEFLIGTITLRSILEKFDIEFDISNEKSNIGNPNEFGVCRLRNDSLIIYTNREVFKKIALALKYNSLSRLTIRLKLYNLYSDGNINYLNGSFTDEWGMINKNLFIVQDNQEMVSDYLSYGIVDSMYEEYRVYEMQSNASKKYQKNVEILLLDKIIETRNELEFKYRKYFILSNFFTFCLFIIGIFIAL